MAEMYSFSISSIIITSIRVVSIQKKSCRLGMKRFVKCFFELFPRATSQVAACRHLATAARVKYPAALQRCKFDTPLLAAGSLIDAKLFSAAGNGQEERAQNAPVDG